MAKKTEKNSKKILMVEDNIFLRKLYRDKLTRAGFGFVEATNGVEGLNKAVFEKPDLIILDLILPRKNGFDVLAELKEKPDVKNTPVIILSNLSQEADIKEAMKLGAEEYLVKTEVRLSEVVDMVKKIIKKS
jgi:two-component system alkaline phosphatase synthesis response regulator PhoP